VANPLNPAAWNRFSYVHNSPTNYVDPSGHCPWCLVGIGAGLFTIFEFGRQVHGNMSSGMDLWNAVHYKNINLGTLGLAAATGAVLGGAVVGQAALVAGVSLAEAATIPSATYATAGLQVGGGAGLTIVATVAGQMLANRAYSVERLAPSDYYFAALWGGLTVPVTGFTELAVKGVIANEVVAEVLADALLGAGSNTAQYASSNIYAGRSISADLFVANIVGGAVGGAISPSILRGSIWNDILVKPFSTVLGAGVIPNLPTATRGIGGQPSPEFVHLVNLYYGMKHRTRGWLVMP
jgi:hypothetical protein